MPDDGTGNMWRKTLRCIVATRAVLFEHPLAIVALMNSLRGGAFVLLGAAGGGCRRSAGSLREERQDRHPEQS